MATKIFITIIFASLTSCSHMHRANERVVVTQESPEKFEGENLIIEVSRKELTEALKLPAKFQRIRLIPILTRTDNLEDQKPEYRLFEIIPGSPYELLGLRNGDLLVRANGFTVYGPQKFVQYVNLLPGEKAAWIEILREERPVMLKYRFVELMG